MEPILFTYSVFNGNIISPQGSYSYLAEKSEKVLTIELNYYRSYNMVDSKSIKHLFPNFAYFRYVMFNWLVGLPTI